MKSIFQRAKNKEEDFPKKFNGFLEFNHSGIIVNSKTAETPLIGCETSDSLFLETTNKDSSIGLILTGEYGKGLCKGFRKRIKNQLSSALYIGFNGTLSDLSDISRVILPEENKPIMSFSQGKKWYKMNEARVVSYIDKIIRSKSLLFVFLDNNPFILGVMQSVLEHIKASKIKPILFLHLPADESDFSRTFSVLAFVYNILKKESRLDTPIVLIDDKYALKQNSNTTLEELSEKLLFREANVIADIMFGTSMNSEFYHTDFSNFGRIFENLKGICSLFSFDAYDNNPDLSKLFKLSDKSSSYSGKQKPTRGYVFIQPGPEGLKTDSYQKIREFIGNSDIILSILNQRGNGALVRGILSYVSTPKVLTDKFSKLDKITVELYDSENQKIIVNDEQLFDEVLNANEYKVVMFEDLKIQIEKEAEGKP